MDNIFTRGIRNLGKFRKIAGAKLLPVFLSALLLAGCGGAVSYPSGTSAQEPAMEEELQLIEQVSEAAEQAQQELGQAAEETAQELAEAAEETVQGFTETTEETVQGFTETTEETVQELTEAATQEPAEKTEKAAPIDEDGTYTTKDDVALYIRTYGKLPGNFITKKEAQSLGWEGGSLEPYAPGKCIGGDYFGNYEGVLPKSKKIKYRECDIGTLGRKSRGAKRIIYSNDGKIYYTDDHYETFTLLYDDGANQW